MPVRVFYKNRELDPCTIRPTPLVTIDTSILKTGGGESYGVSYAITLTGTLLADQGTPYAFKKLTGNPRYDFYVPPTMPIVTYCGPYGVFDRTISHYTNAHPLLQRPLKQKVCLDNSLDAILSKQSALKALFALDGQRLEITDWDYEYAPITSIVCYPRVLNISLDRKSVV